MPSPIYSNIFGASQAVGNVASDPGEDCILALGGETSPEIWQIERIIATYGIPLAIDYTFDGYRSFTGRLLVIDGILKTTLSSAAVPNVQLYTKLPDDLPGPILFDILLHTLDFKPFVFDFPKGEAIGSIRSGRGHGITVILLAGQSYTGAGADVYLTTQFLHVVASKASSNPKIKIGPYETKD